MMGGDPIPGPLDFLRKADSSEMEEIEAVIFHLEGLLRDAKRRRNRLVSRRTEVTG